MFMLAPSRKVLQCIIQKKKTTYVFIEHPILSNQLKIKPLPKQQSNNIPPKSIIHLSSSLRSHVTL